MSENIETRIVWRNVGDDDGAEIKAFWLKNDLILDEAKAEERLRDVCIIAKAGDEVVGVSSIRIDPHLYEGTFVGYFRCAVSAAFRQGGLAIRLTIESQSALEQWSKANPPENVLGMKIVVENAAIISNKRGRQPIWAATGQTLVGLDRNGNQVRVKWFDHALLPTIQPLKR